MTLINFKFILKQWRTTEGFLEGISFLILLAQCIKIIKMRPSSAPRLTSIHIYFMSLNNKSLDFAAI